MNLNKLAVIIAKKEKFYGKKRKAKEMSIGDIKEVMKLTFTELAMMKEEDALRIIRRYK